jgi:hypothetical protein
MSSERRIQASRANGALSRGPVTVQGKINSSRNSTRHGILAQTIVLDSESKARFEQLLSSYTAEFQPRTPAEATLVERMAMATWRQLRVCHIQRADFDLEMARQETPEDSPPSRAATVFRTLSDNSRSLDLLLRYETAFDRQFTRSLNTLLKLQARPNRGDGAMLPREGMAATWDPKNPIFPNDPTNSLKTKCCEAGVQPPAVRNVRNGPAPRGSANRNFESASTSAPDSSATTKPNPRRPSTATPRHREHPLPADPASTQALPSPEDDQPPNGIDT